MLRLLKCYGREEMSNSSRTEAKRWYLELELE